jgi:hypothetical protein
MAHRAKYVPKWAVLATEAQVRPGSRAVCKTVGSAYVGSNPTPATTCENGPLAGMSRLCGPFLLCPAMCHLVAASHDLPAARTRAGTRPTLKSGEAD